MTYEEFFSTLSRIPDGTIFMAMPLDADLSTLRFVANVILPAGREVIVDDEVFFLYARLDDFNDELWASFGKTKRHVVAMALTRYHYALRNFLAVYHCRSSCLLDLGKSVAREDSSEQHEQGSQGDKAE